MTAVSAKVIVDCNAEAATSKGRGEVHRGGKHDLVDSSVVGLIRHGSTRDVLRNCPKKVASLTASSCLLISATHWTKS